MCIIMIDIAGLQQVANAVRLARGTWQICGRHSRCIGGLVLFLIQAKVVCRRLWCSVQTMMTSATSSDAHVHVVGESHPRALHYSETYRTMTA
jgi:hypothetical protein